MMYQQTFPCKLKLDVKGETDFTTSGFIDLFTQKAPYNGKGPNMPSDAFGPGEAVILYALVTINNFPKQGLPVTFSVHLPDSTSFSMVAETNMSGIAEVNFRIPEIEDTESKIFGEWIVLANVTIENITLFDKLTFKVDWVIKLVSLRTVWMINGNLTPRQYFGVGGDLGLEITLRSIAKTMREATISIVVKDELNFLINYSNIPNFKVQPNGKMIHLFSVLSIPKWAHVGNATVIVSAFNGPTNQSGVPYCPAISTNFFITPYEPLTISFHDVSVIMATPSAYLVKPGQIVQITAVVRNEGTENETFNVIAYYDSETIETLQVFSLEPYSEVVLNFTWDTSSLKEGNYTITVSIPYLTEEADRSDNEFVSSVEIRSKVAVIHNIAVVDVYPSNFSVYIGDSINISVCVLNNGTERETFNVTSYYNSHPIETLPVINLTPNTRITITFTWNTSSVGEGDYRIKAEAAPVPGEEDVSDNVFVDGVIHVMARPVVPPPPIHDVAVLDVIPSKTVAYVGEIVQIRVIVKNRGTFTETFNLTIYADLNATIIGDEICVGTWVVRGLEPMENRCLICYWRTEEVTEGNYTLSAVASAVHGEENLENNKFVNGIVWVKLWKFPPFWKIPEEVFVLLSLLTALVLACIVSIFIFILLPKRRKKKKIEQSNYNAKFKNTKTCSICGNEFPATYTFCPYCFSFHGKDY